MSNRKPSRLCFGLFVSAIFFASTRSSNAQDPYTWTWDGSAGTMNWSGANWTNSARGTPGENFIVSSRTTLNFSNATSSASTNQDIDGLLINALSFSGNSTVNSVTGKSILFLPDLNGVTGSIKNSSSQTVTLSHEVYMNTALSIQSDTALVFSGPITGSGGIVKTGYGDTTIGGVLKSYTGETTVAGGFLKISADPTSGSYAWATPAFNIQGPSILQFDGAQFDLGGFASTKTINFDNAGGGQMVSNVSTENLGLNFKGDVTINSNGGAQNKIYGRPFHLGASTTTLTINVAAGTDSQSDVIITSILKGQGRIVKSGNGTLELTYTNEYEGGTTVSAGTLLVTNIVGSATGTGTVTVQSGATLKSGPANFTVNTGTIDGAVTIESGGTISPGLSATQTGVLHLNGGLTMQENSTAVFYLNSTEVGNGFSQIRVSVGTVNLGNSNLEVNLGYTPTATDEFLIVSGNPGSSLFKIPSDRFVTADNLYYFDVNYSTSGVKIFNFTPVPEPTTMMALGVAGLGLFHVARRRLRRC